MTALPGYRRLKRLDFILSSLALFGILFPFRVRLSRKPLKRLFWVGRAKQRYLDVTIVSERREGIRGAVEVSVQYFSLTGRKINAEARKYHLFADPVGHAPSQRLWFTRPHKAAFVLVAISRNKNGIAIGMSCNLHLKRASYDEVEVALGEILRCRDEQLLESAYAKAEEDHEPEHARRILERMIFIWQKPEAIRALAYMEDTRKLVARGFQLPSPLSPTDSGTNSIVYDHLLGTGMGAGVTLTKRLAYEGRLLQTSLYAEKAGIVHIPPGADAFVRLVAAGATGAEVRWEADIDNMDVPAWITQDEAEDYVRSYRS